jgi:propanol-preferring alcohol dehydrogenase
MKAEILKSPGDVTTNPLINVDFPQPELPAGHILVKINVCAVCHTDLHVVEGELSNITLPIIPGHQIVGIVAKCGEGVSRFKPGDRVGIFWLLWACGVCEFCKRGEENLCPYAQFTGYTAQGGYAEYTTVHQDFALTLPQKFSDTEVAPLLCAGIVGYRSIKLSDLKKGERLGLIGYGASADICIQVAHYWGCEVYAFTRSPEHQKMALERGAAWVGQADDKPPAKLDRAIIFAPVGALIPVALGHLRNAGTLCINAIHTSPIPEMPYHLLWGERTIRTVANVTRKDAEEFLPLAAEIPIRSATQLFPLNEANRALQMLKWSQINGSAVLQIS